MWKFYLFQGFNIWKYSTTYNWISNCVILWKVSNYYTEIPYLSTAPKFSKFNARATVKSKKINRNPKNLHVQYMKYIVSHDKPYCPIYVFNISLTKISLPWPSLFLQHTHHQADCSSHFSTFSNRNLLNTTHSTHAIVCFIVPDGEATGFHRWCFFNVAINMGCSHCLQSHYTTQD